MKKVIILIMICIFLMSLMGCIQNDYNQSDCIHNNDQQKIHNEDQKWCSAQSDSVFVNGHYTNLTNVNTNVIVEGCCCVGEDEFICICPDKIEEINDLFINWSKQKSNEYDLEPSVEFDTNGINSFVEFDTDGIGGVYGD